MEFKEVLIMKKKLIMLCTTLIALVLEILPYGAVCNFALDEGKSLRQTFSYFDLTPFGYANFAPLITAVLSCFILLLAAIYCLTGKLKLAVAAKNLLYVTIIISLCPLLLGIDFFSLVGVLISASLLFELLLMQSICPK